MPLLMINVHTVHIYACRRQGVTIKGATEPAGHNHTQSQCSIAIFTSCDVCSKFGDFWGMFRPPKLHLKWWNNNKKEFLEIH